MKMNHDIYTVREGKTLLEWADELLSKKLDDGWSGWNPLGCYVY